MNKRIQLKNRIFQIIEKATEDDKASKKFDIFIMTLIILNTIAIVLESFNSLSEKYSLYFTVFEVISVIIFTIEYLLRVWTSDLLYLYSKGKLSAMLRYIFSPMAIIDLLAILPFYLPMFIPFDLRFLRMFRISRLLRLLKINRYTKALTVIINIIKSKKDELLATVFMMLFMIMISSTMMYYFENQVQPEAFPNIVASFWWAIATLTTVGYGDIYPITAMGKILASIIAVLGIGIVALPTGIISSGFMEVVTNKFKNKEIKIDEEKKEMICPHCGEKIHYK